MKIGTLNPKELIFSLDIGTRSIIGTVGIVRDKKFEVICEKYQEHEERAMVDGQIHDINLVAQVVDNIKRKLEKELEVKLEEVSIAAAGRFLRTCEAKATLELNEEDEIDKDLVRTLELTAVKEAEVNKNTAGKLYCVGYSIKEYYLNSYLISNLLGHKGEEAAVEVIATFLPRSVIDSLYTVMNKVGLKVANLTLEPIAAIEAAVPKNLRLLNIALVDIGAGTSDIAISSKETISSYGMVPMAGDEVTEVIAQEYLVDFNKAEEIKRQVTTSEEITYTDVLGFENTIASEAVNKLIHPIVDKLSESISNRIIELNGGKAPSAVFLVGGGAHTPGLQEELATKLNMPTQRIGIKDRSAVIDCVSDNGLGSAGVTVLGIALTAIRSMGNDFIDVRLNDEPISLFNSHKHTVMDVLLQAGINPSLLIAKTGKNIRFEVNGRKRLAFGGVGTNAVITINGESADIETEVDENDEIRIEYAQNGKDAEAKVSEFLNTVYSKSIFVDDNITNLEPICIINGEEKSVTENLVDNDIVSIFIPDKVSDLKKYVLKDEVELYFNDNKLEDDFVLEEGSRIYTKIENDENIKENIKLDENEKVESKEETKQDNQEVEEEKVTNEEICHDEKEDNNKEEGFLVIINKEKTYLTGKESYIFVDIFNHISFDLTVPKGNIVLLLNNKPAAYTDELKYGDEIEIYWE
ncbi:MAG: cell division protein FtsA [Clostridium sp.]|nr:cell division protein FtsA [Clostridium sp.]